MPKWALPFSALPELVIMRILVPLSDLRELFSQIASSHLKTAGSMTTEFTNRSESLWLKIGQATSLTDKSDASGSNKQAGMTRVMAGEEAAL